MSILYLPNDLLQYIINPFITYYADKENLELLIFPLNSLFKFKKKQHKTVEKTRYFNKEKNQISSISRYTDNELNGISYNYIFKFSKMILKSKKKI